MESNEEILKRHLKSYIESDGYTGIPYLNAMQEFSDQQNATLIEEHRLMKQFIEDVKDGLYGHPHVGAEETLKQITL